MPSKQTPNRNVHRSDRRGILKQASHYLAFQPSKQPLLGMPTVESAIRAPNERGQIIHLKSTCLVHLLQRFDASRELEGVMAGVVWLDIALEGIFLNQDTRSMVHQSKIGIAIRPSTGHLYWNTKICSRTRAQNCSGPSVCDLLVKKYQKLDSCQMAGFLKSVRWVVWKDSASIRPVVHRYVCFEPVRGA